MKVQVTGTKIICDCCGETYENLNGNVCYVGDDDGSEIMSDADSDDWKQFGDKHYCPNCYQWEEDDIIVTKDGHKYDWNTDAEIKEEEK